MRFLLDGCLPKDLTREFPGHAVATVQQPGWTSIKNGKLLQLIAGSGKFDGFVTVDKNLPHPQKIERRPFAVVVLRTESNRLTDVIPFAPEFNRRLPEFQPGHAYVFSHPA